MQILKCVTLFVSLLLTYNTYGKNDLELYYLKSQKATNEVCKGNFNKANELFKAVFKDYHTCYFTELNNALYAAVRSNAADSVYIKKLFSEIALRGISIRERYGNRTGYIAFTNLMVNNNKDSLPAKDQMAINLLNDALIRDQEVRKISEKFFQPSPYTQDITVLPAVRMIDSVNYNEICELLRLSIKKKENLEQTIGYPAVQSLLTILKHSSPWGYYNKELLDSCIFSGVLYAPAVATLYDDYCTSSYLTAKSDWPQQQDCHKVYGIYGGYASLQFPKSCYIFKIEDSLLNVINNRRKQIYLNDVFENAKIVSYAFLFGINGFVYPGVSVVEDREFESAYEQILKDKGIKYILYRGKEDFDYNRKW